MKRKQRKLKFENIHGSNTMLRERNVFVLLILIERIWLYKYLQTIAMQNIKNRTLLTMIPKITKKIFLTKF